MQFTTKIPIPKSNHLIDYKSKMVSLGSCFAVNIADKFNYFNFQNKVNTFGVLFHPLAIHKIIQRAVEEAFFKESELFFHNELWHCYDVHSDLSQSNQEELLQNLNHSLSDLKSQIEAASHILITYGTAWVYRERSSQKVVANCHKISQSQFQKELLSAIEIQQTIQKTIALIQTVNPNASIVFTVSPVRHLKDGFVENQRSKANLITGIHQTNNLQPTTDNLQQVTYFPSYEIMMDELRDYRFYAEDMIHPNQTAIDYIWERFVATFITEESLPIMNEVESIQKALAHRPFHPESESHMKFLQQLEQRMILLQEKVPHLIF